MNTKGRFTFRSVVVLAALGAAMLFSGPAFAGHESTSGKEPAPKQTEEQTFIGPKQDEVLPSETFDRETPDSKNEEAQRKNPKPAPPVKTKSEQPKHSGPLLKVVVATSTQVWKADTQSGKAKGIETLVQAKAKCDGNTPFAYGGGFAGPEEDVIISAPIDGTGKIFAVNGVNPKGWAMKAETKLPANQFKAYAICGPAPHVQHDGGGGGGGGHHNVIVIGSNNNVNVTNN